MGPSLSFGVRSVSVRDADRLGGCGTGVFIGAEVDGEGGKGQELPQWLTWRQSWRPSYLTYLHMYNPIYMHKLRCMHTFHGSIRV